MSKPTVSMLAKRRERFLTHTSGVGLPTHPVTPQERNALIDELDSPDNPIDVTKIELWGVPVVTYRRPTMVEIDNYRAHALKLEAARHMRGTIGGEGLHELILGLLDALELEIAGRFGG